MGLIFHRRTKILPGVRLNVSKSGYSFTLGGRGGSVNIGKKGAYANVGFGHGLRYRAKIAGAKRKSNGGQSAAYDSATASNNVPLTSVVGGTVATLSLFGCIALFFMGQYAIALAVLLIGVLGGALLFVLSFGTYGPAVNADEEETLEADEAGAGQDEPTEQWRILKVGLLIKEVGHLDRLFEDAVRLVVEKDRCNTALLQHGLSIDYVRACLLASQLSQTGFVKESSTRKNTYDLLFSKADMEARLSELNEKGI